MRSHHFHVVFHGEMAIGSSRTIKRVFVQIIDHSILNSQRKTAARTKLGKRNLMLVRQFYLFKQLSQYLILIGRISQSQILQFCDNCQQRHFIKRYLI